MGRNLGSDRYSMISFTPITRRSVPNSTTATDRISGSGTMVRVFHSLFCVKKKSVLVADAGMLSLLSIKQVAWMTGVRNNDTGMGTWSDVTIQKGKSCSLSVRKSNHSSSASQVYLDVRLSGYQSVIMLINDICTYIKCSCFESKLHCQSSKLRPGPNVHVNCFLADLLLNGRNCGIQPTLASLHLSCI